MKGCCSWQEGAGHAAQDAPQAITAQFCFGYDCSSCKQNGKPWVDVARCSALMLRRSLKGSVQELLQQYHLAGACWLQSMHTDRYRHTGKDTDR